MLQACPARFVIIYDQNTPALERCGTRKRAGLAGLLLGEPCRKPEGRSFARFALHPDLPGHLLHELLADGKAEACAAVLACCRTVRLDEGIEELHLRFRRDADTC